MEHLVAVRLSNRVSGINASASIAARKRVAELQAAGRDIIDFTIGEPDLDTPAHVVDAAVAALRRGETHYTPTAGIEPLRELIAEKLGRDSGLSLSSESVIVGSGAKQLIHDALMASVDPGDEVILPAPYWVSYPDMVKLAGGVPVVVPCAESDAFKLAPAALEAAITPRTRWLILNSPNNPSGAVYGRSELQALAAILERHPQVMLMTDDIYEHLTYDGIRHVNMASVAPGLADRTLFVGGFSKSYAMTGWRVGYACGPLELVRAIGKLIGQSTTCASSVSQAAAVAALQGSQDFIEETRAIYQARRDLMHGIVSSIDGVRVARPEGAFYLFPDVSGLVGRRAPSGEVIGSDADLVMYLLDHANVAVIDGGPYGMSPYLRLSYATSMDAIERGCLRMKAACDRLLP